MNLIFRTEPRKEDILNIREIVESTGFFHNYEVEVAVELIQERLNKGIESGYEFVFAEIDGKTVGYTCFGHIACTKSSYDLYWIVTHNSFRGQGIGKKLLSETYRCIKEREGKNVYAETSSKPQYLPTREFYEKNFFDKEAQIKDFYDENDDKVVYVKRL